VALLGPAATQDFAALGGAAFEGLPAGYIGAPFMATLAGGLLARGHRVTVISTCTDLPQGLREGLSRSCGALTLVYVPMRPGAWRPNGLGVGHILDLFRFERQVMQEALVRLQPDVVHAHWAYEFAWAAIDSRLPHVVTCHDSPFRVARHYKGWKLGGYRRIKAWMAWHALRRARCVTTVSPHMVHEIAALCTVAPSLVPNPVAPAPLHNEPLARTAGTGARVLMVSNGWSDLKNPQAGLRAFARVAQVMPDAELVLLGDGFGTGGTAQHWCAEVGITGRMRFVGAVGHNEVRAWMAGSDLLLHPSLEESFGMVAAEALLAGIPVVGGYRSGALPWVVAQAGRLVDVTNPEALAAAMLELLGDPALRARLGEAGRSDVARRFSVQSVAAAYEALYRSAAGPVHAPGRGEQLQGAGSWN
jgi:glycosyltransferase involved in cell wall biosynthesis